PHEHLFQGAWTAANSSNLPHSTRGARRTVYSNWTTLSARTTFLSRANTLFDSQPSRCLHRTRTALAFSHSSSHPWRCPGSTAAISAIEKPLGAPENPVRNSLTVISRSASAVRRPGGGGGTIPAPNSAVGWVSV